MLHSACGRIEVGLGQQSRLKCLESRDFEGGKTGTYPLDDKATQAVSNENQRPIQVFGPLSVGDQLRDQGFGNRVDIRGIVDESALEEGIVAESQDAAPRDVDKELSGPEEPRAILGLVRPCLLGVTIQAVQEDIAVGSTGVVSGRPQVRLRVTVGTESLAPCLTYSTALSPLAAGPSRAVIPSRAIV